MAEPSLSSASPDRVQRRFPAWQTVTVLLLATAAWGVLAHHLAATAFHGDLRGLLHLAAARPHPAAMAGIPRTPTPGYDGQYYAALASDPWVVRSETRLALDNPPYRAMRIGLPAAAWLLTAGRPTAAVVAYQLLCWLGAAAAVFLLAHWLAREGFPIWWALAAGLGAGTLSSVLRCTPDAAAVALILAALLAHRRGRVGAAIALVASAVLVRETSWLAALGMAVGETASGRLRRAGAVLTLSTLPLVVWVAWIAHRFGAWPTAGKGNFAVPFAWVARKATQLGEPLVPNPVEVIGVAAIVAMLVAPLLVLRPALFADAAVVTFALFGGLAWSLGWAVWSDVHAFSRVLLPLPFLAPIVAGAADHRSWRGVVLAVPVTLLAAAGVMAWTLWRAAPPPRPQESTADRLTGTNAPLFVLGAAHTRGRAGLWCTDLELANPWPATLTVTLDVLPGNPARRPARPTLLRLRPREVRVIPDVLGSEVRFYGVVALRITGDRPGIGVRWRTYLASESGDRGAWNPALPLTEAVCSGETAVLAGLAHDPVAGVRSDLVVLNASELPVTVGIALGDGTQSRAVRHESLAPWQFLVLPDLLNGVSSAAVTSATAAITVGSAGGAVLARAAVLRPGAAPQSVAAHRKASSTTAMPSPPAP